MSDGFENATAANSDDRPTPAITQTGEFLPDGSGSVSASLSFSGGTKTGPGWSANYTLSVPVGNYYTISVAADDTATVEGCNISASSHWDASQKEIVPGCAESDYQTLPEDTSATVEFSIAYENVGGPFSLSVIVTSTRERLAPPVVEDEDENPCACDKNCALGSETKNGSVDFSQPFGRTPWAVGVPAGTLRLKIQTPDANFYSPKSLCFEHALTRRVLEKDSSAQSAKISAGGAWENAYKNGVPATENAWKNSQIRVFSDDTVAEFLENRTTYFYDAAGNFSSIKTSRGVVLTASQLGVDVVRDAETDAIRQIWSHADGLLDIVTLDATHYEIRWYKNGDFSEKNASGLYVPANTPIKIFAIGKPASATNNNTLELTEKRGDAFTFKYLWAFDVSKKSWTFSRGETETSERTWTQNADGNYVVTEKKTCGGNVEIFTETISAENGARYVGKTAGGVSEFSSERVASGNGLGKTARETTRSGATTQYSYDAHARVISETRSRGFANLTEETLYSYAGTASEFVDFRPREIVHKIAGTVFKTETFSFDDAFENGAVETHSTSANGETQTEETRYFPVSSSVSAGRVSLEIHADLTTTLHEYSAVEIPQTVDLSSNLGYTETTTHGIFENGAFAVVPKKSTRVVRVFDTRGNEIRTEKWAHTGADFEQISWENKTYSPAHKIVASERSDGKTTSADYICTGPIFTVDENGVRTDFAYDAAKRLASSTRHGARGDVLTTFSHDASGRVISETKSCGELSSSVSRTFNADGSLASETDALGNQILYTNSADGLTETKTFPDGSTETTVRNAAGDLVSRTGTAVVAQFYAYEFDATNALKISTTFFGENNSARWEKTFEDGFGRVVKTERSGFGGNAILTTENAYAGTRLVRTTETDFPQIDYVHDALGNVISTTQTASDGTQRNENLNTIFEKDSDSVIWKTTTREISSSDENLPARTSAEKTRLTGLSLSLESETISVDVRGNATAVRRSYDLTTKTRTKTTAFPHCSGEQISIEIDGAETSLTRAGCSPETAEFDAFGRKISATDARGNTTNFSYDAASRLVSQTDASGAATTFEYDSRGRETKRIFDNGTFVASAYDLRGNKVAEFGDAAYPVKFTFDDFGQKISQETFRALAGTAEELANLTDGDLTHWSYDAATGALLSKTDALGNATNYAYTASGLLASRTWARGITTTYAYDAWRQLVSTNYSDATTAISHGYDALGQIVSTTDYFGTKTFSYDAFGAISSETHAAIGLSREISRDAFGRATNEILRQNGNIVFLSATSYDAATGRISSATFGGIAFAYGYLSGTNLISQIAVADGAILTKKISYEAQRDFQTEIAYVNSANALIAKRNYVFDTLGRVSGRTQTRGTEATRSDAFSYNSRSELISVAIGNENFTYDFDNIGNRTSTTEAGTINVYTTNSVNQYSAIMSGDEAFSPTYDFDGNATLIKTSTGTWSVSWNAENRPIRFENAATATVVTLAYDALGRCAEREVSSAGAVVSRECFVYNDFLQIAAFDVAEDATGTRSFSLKRTVFWDPTEPIATRPLAVNIVGDQVYFPTVDLTKNVCELVKIDGSVAAFYDYTPFGLPTETSTAGTGETVAAGTNSDGTTSAGTSNLPANPFKFSSEVYDSDLGLVYYNYRHYSPTLGRFLSRDPIEEFGGVNLYCLIENNPTGGFDIEGLLFSISTPADRLPKSHEGGFNGAGWSFDWGVSWKMLTSSFEKDEEHCKYNISTKLFAQFEAGATIGFSRNFGIPSKNGRALQLLVGARAFGGATVSTSGKISLDFCENASFSLSAGGSLYLGIEGGALARVINKRKDRQFGVGIRGQVNGVFNVEISCEAEKCSVFVFVGLTDATADWFTNVFFVKVGGTLFSKDLTDYSYKKEVLVFSNPFSAQGCE